MRSSTKDMQIDAIPRKALNDALRGIVLLYKKEKKRSILGSLLCFFRFDVNHFERTCRAYQHTRRLHSVLLSHQAAVTFDHLITQIKGGRTTMAQL